MFDNDLTNFDPETKRLSGSRDIDDDRLRKFDHKVEVCGMQVKGTSYLTRCSKYEMKQMCPLLFNPNTS